MIEIDLQSRTPIYEQLQEQILRLSLLGVLDQNEQLPSVRALAREIGVNPNTVAKAYSQLEADGITYSVAGRGSFIRGDAVQLKEVHRKHLAEFKETVVRAKSLGLLRDELVGAVDEVFPLPAPRRRRREMQTMGKNLIWDRVREIEPR